jgi:hypothetical protein
MTRAPTKRGCVKVTTVMEGTTRPRRMTRATRALVLVAFVLVGLLESVGATAAVTEVANDTTSAVVSAHREGRHAVQVVRATASHAGGIGRRIGGSSGRGLSLALVTLTLAAGITGTIRGRALVLAPTVVPGRVRRRGPPGSARS